MLVLDTVSKTFLKDGGKITALFPQSLNIEAGEFIAVQGASGSGKTTLLLISGGLLHPTQGNVLIFGTDLYKMSHRARTIFRAQNIGFVFQQYHLVPFLSVTENIVSPELAFKTPEAKIKCDELIEKFGLTHRRHHFPPELSAGEKQRTALARALLHQPKLLLADEITGNLDQKNADIVLGQLKEFASNGGAVLLVTHDAKAADTADRIITIEPANS